jgi:hypothetical protein
VVLDLSAVVMPEPLAAAPAAVPDADPLRQPAPADLVVTELGDRGGNKRDAARLVGVPGGPFARLDLPVGRRQLFFFYVLSRAVQTHSGDPVDWTLVAEACVREEFLRWVKSGILKVDEKDLRNPESRITRDWAQFVRQMSRRDARLGELLQAIPKTPIRPKQYAIRLSPGRLLWGLPPIESLYGLLAADRG